VERGRESRAGEERAQGRKGERGEGFTASVN